MSQLEEGAVKPSTLRTYTCSDYREEMRLLGLRRRLEGGGLTDEERQALEAEIEAAERALALD